MADRLQREPKAQFFFYFLLYFPKLHFPKKIMYYFIIKFTLTDERGGGLEIQKNVYFEYIYIPGQSVNKV